MEKTIAAPKMTIELTYNGFHGKNSFNLRVPQPEKFNGDNPYGDSNTYILDLSASQIARINKVVGCRTHRMVFGNLQNIEGAIARPRNVPLCGR